MILEMVLKVWKYLEKSEKYFEKNWKIFWKILKILIFYGGGLSR